MKKFSLAAKFNLVFLAVAVVGFAASSIVTNALLVSNAREETLQKWDDLKSQSQARRTFLEATRDFHQ